MTIGVIGMLFVSMSLWKYDYTNMWLFRWDYKILLKLAVFRWHYRDLLDSFNIFMVVYMAAVQLFRVPTRKNGVLFAKKEIIYGAVFVVFCILYILFFDSDTAFEIYKRVVLSDNSESIKTTIRVLNYIFIYAQTFYILNPGIRLLIHQRSEEFWIKRNQMIAFGIYIFTLGIFVVVFFVMGPLKNNYMDMTLDNILGMRKYFRIGTYQYISLVTVLCVYIMGMLRYILKAKVLRTSAFIRYKFAKKKWNIDADTREIFHMFKNILFNVEAMSKQALREEKTECKDAILNDISQFCENHIDEFFEITALAKKVTYEIVPTYVYEMINNAVNRCEISNDIDVVYEYSSKNIMVYADSKSIEEVLVNILQNAIEAFENYECKDKYIKIKVRNDNELVVIDIIDNGQGIKKKEIKSVFRSLYTSKSRRNNWGIGLAFVYKTIMDHGGHIKITSKEKEGTCVSIILYRQEVKRI